MERLIYKPKIDQGPLAYSPFLDSSAYSGVDLVERRKIKPYTRKQIETHVGERFNVVLSTVRYDLKNGHMYGQNTNEPAIEMFKRGVGREGSTQTDIKRELAEIIGFEEADRDFPDPKTKLGKKRISISPPSGSYQHNFYDVFTLLEDSNGRYVEARRYSSGLSAEQTVSRFKEKGLIGESYKSDPEYTLSHPIEIEADDANFPDADSIHKFLHVDHDFATEEELRQIHEINGSLYTSYINTLVNNPFAIEDILINYDAILVQSDIAFEAIRRNDQSFLKALKLKSQFSYPTKNELKIMAAQPVRKAMIGCGFSGGLSGGMGMETMSSPFSVLDKDPNKNTQEKTILCCTCPFCKQEVEAVIGGGRITCPNCEKSASWSR